MKFEFDGITVTNNNALHAVAKENALISAFIKDQNITVTENGCKTYVSTMNANLDLFALLGVTQDVDIAVLFSKAFAEDKTLAVRILQFTRDCRGGKGKRSEYIELFKQLITMDKELAVKILKNTANIGRYKDIFEMAFDTVLEKDALKILSKALNSDAASSALCAKWCPRQGVNANKLRGWMKLNPKEYRKLLVSKTNVVEQQMCAKQWDKIVYKAVPSVAALRYQSAFAKNDAVRYESYKEALKTGAETVNASVLWPHSIVENIIRNTGDDVVLDAQWKALPNFCQSTERMLPLVDVSASMSSAGVMHIAIALGLYLAERNQGAFYNHFLTFSSDSYLDTVKGVNLREKVRNMHSAHWGRSTNLEAGLKSILDKAKACNVSVDEMPTMLIILSDMEFDIATKVDQTMFDRMKEMYQQAGYTMPKIVFWNLDARGQKVPVSKQTRDVALVGGFSPAVMKAVLNAEDFSPMGIMLKSVMIDRYVS